MIRDEVRQFVALGPLPPESDETMPDEEFQRHGDLLERIIPPVTDDEATLLLTAFGEDDCFGLAWTLLHLIETAPHLPVDEPPAATANEWVRRIWDSAQRAKARRGGGADDS